MADSSSSRSEVEVNLGRKDTRKQLMLTVFATLLIVVVATCLAGVTTSSQAGSGIAENERPTSQGGAIVAFGLFGGCLLFAGASILRSKRRSR